MTISILDQGCCLWYISLMNDEQEKKITSEKPVSLAPLNLTEALGGLLKVKPEPKPQKKKRKRK